MKMDCFHVYEKESKGVVGEKHYLELKNAATDMVTHTHIFIYTLTKATEKRSLLQNYRQAVVYN